MLGCFTVRRVIGGRLVWFIAGRGGFRCTVDLMRLRARKRAAVSESVSNADMHTPSSTSRGVSTS